jgi:hypothetical protein
MGALLSAPCKIKESNNTTYYLADKNKTFAYCNVPAQTTSPFSPTPAECTISKPCKGPVQTGQCSIDDTPLNVSCTAQSYNGAFIPVPIDESSSKVSNLNNSQNYLKGRWDYDKIVKMTPAVAINEAIGKPYEFPQDLPYVENELDAAISALPLISMMGAPGPAVSNEITSLMKYTPFTFSPTASPPQASTGGATSGRIGIPIKIPPPKPPLVKLSPGPAPAAAIRLSPGPAPAAAIRLSPGPAPATAIRLSPGPAPAAAIRLSPGPAPTNKPKSNVMLWVGIIVFVIILLITVSVIYFKYNQPTVIRTGGRTKTKLFK